MKQHLLLSALLLTPPAFAIDAGIGLGVSGPGSSTLYVPIKVTSSLRMEPFLGYINSYKYNVTAVVNPPGPQRQTTQTQRTAILGMGLFYTAKSIGNDPSAWYIGTRLSASPGLTTTTGSSSSNTDTHSPSIAAVFGVNTQIRGQFMIGTEISIHHNRTSYVTTSQAAGSQNIFESQNDTTRIATQILLRYLF